MKSNSVTSVAVVGAGPYGISVAAHVRRAGLDLRVFGLPMHRWRQQMPKGMFLKSEGVASSLSDPDGRHTLGEYCATHGIPYADTAKPVPLDVFASYAMDFQQRLVPEVEEVMVRRIERAPGGDGFELELANGERFVARRVVLATGLEHAEHVPPELAGLPPDLLSHVSAHHDLAGFKGRDVTVVGAGQSALETAALLAEEGARVRVLVRGSSVAWNPPPDGATRSLYRRLRSPSSGLGSSLQLWAYCRAPRLFRYLPRSVRFERFKNVLGPAGGWWLKERVIGRVPILTGHAVSSAEARQGVATLNVALADGRSLRLDTEHVIAATGYRFAVDRLPFLGPHLKSKVRTLGPAPTLTADFESSVPGLYFTGISSGLYFGPVMRFLFGTDYTARRVCRHLVASRLRDESSQPMARLQTASQVR